MKKDVYKKTLFFLITMSAYAGIFLLGFSMMLLLQKMIPVHPYIVLIVYIVLFLFDHFLTKRIVYSRKIMDWLQQF